MKEVRIHRKGCGYIHMECTHQTHFSEQLGHQETGVNMGFVIL